MPRLAALLLAAGLFVLSACDGGGGGSATPTPSVTDAITATPTAPGSGPAPEDTPITDTTAPPEFDGTRGPVEGNLGFLTGVPPAALAVDMRMALHQGYDRVVFEFTGAPPYYRAEYVEAPIHECGSGLEAPLEGEAFLQVQFNPAAAHDESGERTLDGDSLSVSDGRWDGVRQITMTCDFEGVVTWVIGIGQETDFRVLELQDPLRLAIDLQRP